jgi:5-methylthioadenosine/S-adenosylhomocysteine deaminase
MARFLIKDIDWIATVDPERRLIKEGAIAVDGDRIEAVGKSAELGQIFKPDMTIDGRGLMAVPGLIDTTVAPVQQLGRGAGELCDMSQYRLERTLAYEGALTPEDASSAARACMLEMTLAGTTCFVDSGSRFPDEIATAADAAGLRALISRSCFDQFDTVMGQVPASLARETTQEAVKLAAAAVEHQRRRANPRIRAGIALPWLAACTDDLCRSVTKLAAASKVQVIAGAGCSRDDAVGSRLQHGKTETERLQDAGLLGPMTIVSHAGWTSPTDMVALRDTNTNVACCPSMSHRLGTGSLEFGRYPELLAFGVNVTLGSGSPMASNYVDIARQFYLFSGGNKSFRVDATVTPPETSLEAATINGARAIGLDKEIGSLEAGKKADIVLFRVHASDWVPLINPLANLVFSSRGGAHTVIVDGEVLLQDRRPKRIVADAVLAECQERAQVVMARSGLARYCTPQWPIV